MGVSPYAWSGYWARWSDAIREAGYEPNKMITAIPEEDLLASLAGLVRKLGRFPALSDLRFARNQDPTFPSSDAIDRRFGVKEEKVARVLAYCASHDEWYDVAAICRATAPPRSASEESEDLIATGAEPVGYVYMMRLPGSLYKIGWSRSPGRREYELGTKMPVKPVLVHQIATDDPVGIEKYWHGRFQDRRTNGEWFKLSQAEVTAFRRRRFM